MAPAGYGDVLLEGLAPDGGLVVPETLPTISRETLESWRRLSYPSLAAQVLALFATDFGPDLLRLLTASAYAVDRFAAPEVVPLRRLDDDLTLVGLSEGPTLAFKDMAMQFLGEALQYQLARTGTTVNILGATSGDTGSAAEYALRGKHGVAVFMLSPAGRMSAFQRAQMYSLDDENIHNLAIEGVFDDGQNLVKSISADLDFKREFRIGTVNSINFGRVSAQIVYYVWAWLRMTDALSAEERGTAEIAVSVPSGNFGNILSGHYARSMGVPIRRLVLATNENNVLEEFFRTGVYRPRAGAETHETSSPSMDISKASNLERFVYDLLGRDPEALAAAWRRLDADGVLDLSEHQPRFEAEFGIVGGTSTHADRVEAIRAAKAEHGVLLDPHTADGVVVARRTLLLGVPMLVLETAKPTKFPDILVEATGAPAPIPARLEGLLDAPQHVTTIPVDEDAVRAVIRGNAAL